MRIWKKTQEHLSKGNNVMLLLVIDSQGSSPGRTGFKMIVAESGEMHGSIGGGIMEHKLVELCLNDLLKGPFSPMIMRQVHQPDIGKDRSGMICSGEQTIAFYALSNEHAALVSELIKNEHCGIITANEHGISLEPNGSLANRYFLEISGTKKWNFKEDLRFVTELHIVGGGHVGLALSKFAFELGLKVIVYDDREGLNTIKRNQFAECIAVSDYSRILEFMTVGSNSYVVLMSFGFRTDKIILDQLLDLDVPYLGMMGSAEKVDTMFKEMTSEGLEREKLDMVFAPIGVQISSKTPEEIAISILAEIIQKKNDKVC